MNRLTKVGRPFDSKGRGGWRYWATVELGEDSGPVECLFCPFSGASTTVEHGVGDRGVTSTLLSASGLIEFIDDEDDFVFSFSIEMVLPSVAEAETANVFREKISGIANVILVQDIVLSIL
jgi:hypothetical protein